MFQTELSMCDVSLQGQELLCVCGLAVTSLLKDIHRLSQLHKFPDTSACLVHRSKLLLVLSLISLIFNIVLVVALLIYLVCLINPSKGQQFVTVVLSRLYIIIKVLTIASFFLEVLTLLCSWDFCCAYLYDDLSAFFTDHILCQGVVNVVRNVKPTLRDLTKYVWP